MDRPLRTLVLLVAITAVYFCNETPETYSPTLEDAKKDKAMERGWIPQILPSTAKEIIERHNIDTNEVWIKFKADVSGLKLLLGQLRTLTKKEINGLFPFRHPKKWWMPTDNTKHSFSIAAYDYTFKWGDGRTDSKTGYFFLDIKNAIGFYYRPTR